MFLFLRLMLCCISFFYFGVVLADQEASTTPSFGEFATQLSEPVGILGDFMSTGSIVLGIMSFFAAFLRYLQYRVNPLSSPLSTVVTLIILGILFICLPFLHLLGGSHVPPYKNP